MEAWELILVILAATVCVALLVMWIAACQIAVAKQRQQEKVFQAWDDAGMGRHD